MILEFFGWCDRLKIEIRIDAEYYKTQLNQIFNEIERINPKGDKELKKTVLIAFDDYLDSIS